MTCWFYIFYRLIHIPHIHMRKPHTSLLTGFLSIIGVLFSHNFQLIFMNTPSIKYIPFTNLLTYFFIMLATGGTYSLLTFRAYMVYYDICWNKAMENKKWRLFIDPDEKNYFLKNKNYWGSQKRIAMIAFLHLCFWFIIGASAIIYNGPNQIESFIARTSIVLGSILILTCDIILYIKFPQFEDYIGLLDETKIIIKYKVISVTIYLIVAIVLDAPIYSIEYFALAVLGIFVAFGFVTIIYFWVFRKFQLPIVPWNIDRFTHKYAINKQLSVNIMQDKNTLNDLNLKQVLQHEIGFEYFSRHLSKEYCIENILFFVETHQWLLSLLMKKEYQKFVATDILNIINETENQAKTNKHMHQLSASIGNIFGVTVTVDTYVSDEQLLTIMFPDNAPKSRIVTDNFDNEENVEHDENDDYPSVNEYMQCIKIFKKFITNSAYFCVNIDSASRYGLYQIFGFKEYDSSQKEEDIVKILKNKTKMTRTELFHLFDGCRTQVYQLLNFAFMRFKITKEYKKLKQKCSNDSPKQ
eukprot:157842_1